MRGGRILIFVVLFVVILAAVAFIVFTQFINKPKPAATATQAQQQAMTEVFIAAQNIPQGTPITEDLLGTIKLPSANVLDVMFTLNEKGTLLSKVAKQNIDQGTPITDSMVLDASAPVPITGPKWATSIPHGMTAISIPASRFSLAARSITSGAHVNVNACFQFVDIDPSFQTILPNDTAPLSSTGFLPDTLTALTLTVGDSRGPQGRVELDPSLQQPYYLIPSDLDGGMQRPRLVCQTLLQDVMVMRVGNFNPAEAQANPTPVGAPTAQPKPQQQQQQQQQPQQIEDIVTLIVLPQDALTLTYLMYTDAAITMTLRNPTDLARQATEPVMLAFLLGQYNIPVPVKMPYSIDVPYDPRNQDLNLVISNPPDLGNQ